MTDAQFVAVVGLLTEIRDALVPRDEPEPAEFDEGGHCLHPEYLQVSVGHNEWICRRCRFHFSGVADGREVTHG